MNGTGRARYMRCELPLYPFCSGRETLTFQTSPIDRSRDEHCSGGPFVRSTRPGRNRALAVHGLRELSRPAHHVRFIDRIRSVAQRSVPLHQSPRSGNAARFGIDEPRHRTSDSPMDIVFTCGYGDLISHIRQSIGWRVCYNLVRCSRFSKI
jgi:hypothetical protein